MKKVSSLKEYRVFYCRHIRHAIVIGPTTSSLGRLDDPRDPSESSSSSGGNQAF